jgi:GT2 family glycosyltransferase
LLKKSTLDKFPQGRLHEDFFMYGEDEQWCWYIAKVLGLKSLYFPDGKVTHYLGGSAKTKSNPLDNYFNKMLRNQYLFLCWSKGVFYARIYYFLKIVLSLSEPRKSSWKIAGRYWAFIKDVTLRPLTIEELGGRAKK